MTSQLRFSDGGRTFDRQEEIELITAGVDVGSSTSHLAFSHLVLQRAGSGYVVSRRRSLFESEIVLTPYADDLTIDAPSLKKFVSRQYAEAELRPDQVDTGVLIMTGVAARRENSRAIAEIFAEHAGRFVSVSAGDALETQLLAHGSGAIALSAANPGLRVMNVDLGGGTSKIAVCKNGDLVDLTVIDVGARLVSFGRDGRIAAIETSAYEHAETAGVRLAVGDKPSAEVIDKLVRAQADALFLAMQGSSVAGRSASLFRLKPLEAAAPPDVLTFSGGVAEYLYGREHQDHGDLGPLLAAAIRKRLNGWARCVKHSTQCIRATVVGASQYTVQLSGNTVFASSEAMLPLRNVAAVMLDLPLDSDHLDPEAIAAAAMRATEMQSLTPDGPVAWCYKWAGSASYLRIGAFCEGVLRASSSSRARGLPLILVTDSDVGGLIGMHLHENCKLETRVISIDGIELQKFDYIDIGGFIEGSGAVPVIIKSLVFPAN